jgi:hypothetical protein
MRWDFIKSLWLLCAHFYPSLPLRLLYNLSLMTFEFLESSQNTNQCETSLLLVKSATIFCGRPRFLRYKKQDKHLDERYSDCALVEQTDVFCRYLIKVAHQPRFLVTLLVIRVDK